MLEILKSTAHRPWALPRGPWVMRQVWHDLLFAHWAVAAGALRPLIPPQLEIDTFGGNAWIGVVPFRMSGVRMRGPLGLRSAVSGTECADLCGEGWQAGGVVF